MTSPLKQSVTLADVCEPDRLMRAWRKIKANAGMPGVDGERIRDFAEHLDSNLTNLRGELLSGQYRPLPVRRIWRPKADGGTRPIAILALRDRVAQRAMHDALAPLFERKFLPCNIGYREGLGIKDAVKRIIESRKRGLQWVVDGDIDKCFERLDHTLLLDLIGREVRDRGILRLIEAWLNSEVLNDLTPSTHHHPSAGTTQGGALSPLLANIYLHTFDMSLTRCNLALTRYADDWVIQCPGEVQARRALEQAENELSKIHLSVNSYKTRITHFSNGFCFLGVFFLRDEYFHLSPAESSGADLEVQSLNTDKPRSGEGRHSFPSSDSGRLR